MTVLTPLALARMSQDMFGAGRGYKTDKEVPLIKYYLYCACIELGLKAAILATDYLYPPCKPSRSGFGQVREKGLSLVDIM